jgi:hypothetical protein
MMSVPFPTSDFSSVPSGLLSTISLIVSGPYSTLYFAKLFFLATAISRFASVGLNFHFALDISHTTAI